MSPSVRGTTKLTVAGCARQATLFPGAGAEFDIRNPGTSGLLAHPDARRFFGGVVSSNCMRVLVTGGTGFVGRNVVAALHREGCEVRVLLRPGSKSGIGCRVPVEGVEVFWGDVLHPATLLPAMAGVDAVVHLVGIISEAGGSTFERLHVDATRCVLESARRCGVRKYVHMSALGTRDNAVARYHRTKWAAEELVRSSGLGGIIFRPSLIFGPEDHFVNLFASIARRSPLVPMMGPGTNLMQPVDVATVATCFARAAVGQGGGGRTYDLCGMERLEFRDVLAAIPAAMGCRRRIVSIPWRMAGFMARCSELLFAGLLRRPPPLNRDQLLMLQEDNVGNPDEAVRVFQVRPREFREGIGEWLRPGADSRHGVTFRRPPPGG